jgi:alanine racemase
MYSIQEIVEAIDATVLQRSGCERTIRNLCLDSRQVILPDKSVFIALPGIMHDGHIYLKDAHQKGMRMFVISRQNLLSEMPDCDILLVSNTLDALQSLAALHRSKYQLQIIGITGSQGKTWIKEWLFQLLHPEYKVVRSPRSYNSQTGVPLSLWQINSEHTLGIFEAGISKPGEMEKLEAMIRPNMGVFTFWDDAHDKEFRSLEDKLEEKLRLFTRCDTIFFSGQNPLVSDIIRNRCREKKLVSWSTSRSADLQVLAIDKSKNSTHITYSYHGKENSYDLPLLDSSSIENSLLCALILEYLNLDPAEIRLRIAGLSPVKMGLEIKEIENHCLLVHDRYTFDLASLKLAMEILNQHGQGRSKTVILSDPGDSLKGRFHQLINLLKEHRIERLIGVGSEIQQLPGISDQIPSASFYPDTDSMVANIAELKFKNEAILLKGARKFRFDKIGNKLRNKVHSAILEVDFNALLHNLQFFSSKLKAGTKMMVMVKAAAYGTGSVEIARFLAYHNVDYLAVAYIDEGISLRKAGIQKQILVMNPDLEEIDLLSRYNLEPEVYSLTQLEYLSKIDGSQMPDIHLKLDTGMRRLGFDDIDALTASLKKIRHVKVLSVFTHLAATYMPEEHAFTLNQLKRFETGFEKISRTLGYRPMRHVLNSCGIVNYNDYQFEMVRLGIGLYGVGLGHINNNLEPVHTLRGRISQLRDIDKGDSVGYSRDYTATKKMRIATINIGYADGIMRQAGNENFHVMIKGRSAPLIGNVCMDMCMADVSDIREATEGDEVLFFGRELPLEILSRACNTIEYEILTRISPRITRIFHYA